MVAELVRVALDAAQGRPTSPSAGHNAVAGKSVHQPGEFGQGLAHLARASADLQATIDTQCNQVVPVDLPGPNPGVASLAHPS